MTGRNQMALAVAFLTAFAYSPAAIAQGTKINLGYATAADYLPAFVAKENGCFAKNGLDVTLTRMQIVGNIPPALVSGSLQIGIGTATVLIQAVDGGLELVAIATAARMLKANPTISLVVRQGVEIKSAADVKGKKIGVPGLNSVADMVFRKWLKNNGVRAEDATFIETPFPQMSDLLKAGTVDAVTAVEPIRSRIVSAGIGSRAPEEYYVAVHPDTLLSFYTATSQWAKANPQAIKSFRTCLTEALTDIKAQPDKAKEVEKQYLGFNTPTLPSFVVDIKSDDFKFFVELSKEFNLIRKDIDVTKLVAP
jgi:NitT/TauT family transport system substrate-binding protein